MCLKIHLISKRKEEHLEEQSVMTEYCLKAIVSSDTSATVGTMRCKITKFLKAYNNQRKGSYLIPYFPISFIDRRFKLPSLLQNCLKIYFSMKLSLLTYVFRPAISLLIDCRNLTVFCNYPSVKH